MGNKTKTGDRRGQGVRLGDGTVVGNIQLATNPTRLADQNVQRLLDIKKRYKVKLERELRENQMHGVTFIICKVMDELFDELAQR